MPPKTSIVTLFIAIAFTSHAYASEPTLTGTWKTIDDARNKARSIIRIVDANNQFEGSIEKIFPELHEEQNPKCDKCSGALKDQPFVGLKILNGMKKDNEEYNSGTIVDPENGKSYRCKMWLEDGGAKLKVRGYIGPFFRTQIWLRE